MSTTQQPQQEDMAGISRRKVLQGLVAASAAVATASTATAAEHTRAHNGHNGHAMGAPSLMETALHCIRDGELCQHHIMGLLTAGDTSLAQCSRLITDMKAMCHALVSLSAHDSEFLPSIAAASIPVNEACEAECRKHADHHEICRTLADSCAACTEECKKIAA